MPSKHFTPILDALTARTGSVSFVQIGANDGVHSDPIERYIASGAWHGILVEPVPYLFEQLVARYGSRPDLILENCAIAPADGERPFYYVAPAGDESDIASQGIGSFSLAHILKHAASIPNLGKRIRTMQVPCLSLATLFAKHGVVALDAFVLDVEGFDWEIIRTLPMDQVRPAVLMYEHQHLKPDAHAACDAFLRDNGYEILARHSNALAVRADALAAQPALAAAWEGAVAGSANL